ncbi:hypothetical protein ABK040_004968 [Willaertia magna]
MQQTFTNFMKRITSSPQLQQSSPTVSPTTTTNNNNNTSRNHNNNRAFTTNTTTSHYHHHHMSSGSSGLNNSHSGNSGNNNSSGSGGDSPMLSTNLKKGGSTTTKKNICSNSPFSPSASTSSSNNNKPYHRNDHASPSVSSSPIVVSPTTTSSSSNMSMMNKKRKIEEYKGKRFNSTNVTTSIYGKDNRTFVVGLLGYDLPNPSSPIPAPSNSSTNQQQGIANRLGNFLNQYFLNNNNPNTNNTNNANNNTNNNNTTTVPLEQQNREEDDHRLIHARPAKFAKHISKWRELDIFKNVAIKQLSAGGYHLLVLTNDHKVYSAGWNKYGQLGAKNDSTTSKLVLTNNNKKNNKKDAMVDEGEDFDETLAIDNDIIDMQQFYELQFPERIVKVNASGRHSLFLSESGRVYGTGCNMHGRLGQLVLNNNNNEENNFMNESIGAVFKPLQVGGELESKRAYYIGKAFWHSIVGTCDGKVYVMGQYDEGKLGVGLTSKTNEERHVYSPIEIVELKGKELIECEGGAWHSVFLCKSNSPNTKNNEIFVCGSNYWAQLGIENENLPKNNPNVIVGTYTMVAKPIQIPFFVSKTNRKDPSINPIQISAGSNFNVVLCEDGTVYTFGCSSSGKTGLGHCATLKVPTRVMGLPQNIVKISTGSNHSVFLNSEGDVYSVGWNFYGQCGYDEDINNGIEVICDQFNSPSTPTVRDIDFANKSSQNYIVPRIRRLTGVKVESIASGAYFTVCTTSKESGINAHLINQVKGIKARGFYDLDIICQSTF